METIRLTGRLEPRGGWRADRCSIADALEHVGARSTLLILREALYGTTRFDDFAERVGLSDSVTAARLREMVDEGLLEREAYREPGQRSRHQYRLTQKGAELLPVLAALMQWGDRWVAEKGGPVKLIHHECGEQVGVELRCAAGHRVREGELDLGLPPRARAKG
jgi:DNA-binding HxlR family transcriptional regulator